MKTLKTSPCRKWLAIVLIATMLFAFTSCDSGSQLTGEQKDASADTEKTNEEVYALLDFDDKQEFEFAEKGLLAAPKALEILDDSGKLI
ncbi:MAG: hypothetical protein LBN34_00025 [Clostridiales Family XIII bacterium]|jgi:alkyl sulfatase BDS1-like metallo-beta-lactamase superfamily hydrolase|nr:hypothetical protein [Clostridiales Family XIII bacterium]